MTHTTPDQSKVAQHANDQQHEPHDKPVPRVFQHAQIHTVPAFLLQNLSASFSPSASKTTPTPAISVIVIQFARFQSRITLLLSLSAMFYTTIAFRLKASLIIATLVSHADTGASISCSWVVAL